ncbi:MAG TPA: DUF523 domain-containing protein [Candidatus Woesearchaeota archaeon]|nr:DUF523 domain-containing protein [Candidatus Woesearchaeota archaeon]
MIDDRSSKVVFLAHCLLNTNTKYRGSLKGGSRYSSVAPGLIQLLNKYDLGIEQMPCPEIGIAEIDREPRTKDMYDTEDMRKACKMYSEFVKKMIEKFEKGKVKVFGIIGVSRSPTCGISTTYVGKDLETARIQPGAGIFMEELKSVLKEKGLEFMEYDQKDITRSLNEIEKKIKFVKSVV